MSALEIATSVLGIIGDLGKGAFEAITAARATKEEEAFAILDGVLASAGDSVAALAGKIAANKAEALKALDEKFPAPQPTVLVDPAKIETP